MPPSLPGGTARAASGSARAPAGRQSGSQTGLRATVWLRALSGPTRTSIMACTVGAQPHPAPSSLGGRRHAAPSSRAEALGSRRLSPARATCRQPPSLARPSVAPLPSARPLPRPSPPKDIATKRPNLRISGAKPPAALRGLSCHLSQHNRPQPAAPKCAASMAQEPTAAALAIELDGAVGRRGADRVGRLAEADARD